MGGPVVQLPIEKHVNSNSVQIWFCAGCKAIHRNLGNERVDLDREQFSLFAERVADIHYASYAAPAHNVFDIPNLEMEGKHA